MSTAAPPTSNTSAPPTTSRTSKWTRKPQSTTTSTSLSSLFMTLITTNRPTQGIWKNRSSTSNFSILSWSIKSRLTNGRRSSMPKALNSRPCRHNSSTQKSESTLEGLNLQNRSPTKSKRSRPNFSNLSNPSPLDLTISNETMKIAAMAKEDEEATKATLATMVETIAMATILVAKAKTTKIGVTVDIPTTRISPVSYMEGDTVQKNASRSRSRPANANSSRHLAEISKTNNNEAHTAITSPILTIARRTPPMSLAWLSTTLRLLVQMLIHPPG